MRAARPVVTHPTADPGHAARPPTKWSDAENEGRRATAEPAAEQRDSQTCGPPLRRARRAAAPYHYQLRRVLLKLRRSLLDSLGLSGGVDLAIHACPAGELVDGPVKRLWRRLRLARHGHSIGQSKQGNNGIHSARPFTGISHYRCRKFSWGRGEQQICSTTSASTAAGYASNDANKNSRRWEGTA